MVDETNSKIGILALTRRALSVFDRASRVTYGAFAVVYTILATLDLVALGLIATAVGGDHLRRPAAADVELPGPLAGLVHALGGPRHVSLVGLVTVALALFALRSLLSAWTTWRATRFLGRLDADLGRRVIAQELRRPWLDRMRQRRGDVVRDLTEGPSQVSQQFLGSLLEAWSEVVVLMVAIAVLAVSRPTITAFAVVYFGVVGIVLAHRVRRRATDEGERAYRARGDTIASLTQALDAYKELEVRQRTFAFARHASDRYGEFARAYARNEWLYEFARFFLEFTLALGLLLIAGVGALVSGADSAIGVLVLFAAAGFRAVPALHRLQVVGGRVRFRAPYVDAFVTLLHEDLHEVTDAVPEPQGSVFAGSEVSETSTGLADALEVRGLSIRYPDAAEEALRDVSLTIRAGTRVALVGPSGAGKTTLADSLLGLLSIAPGTVFMDGADLVDILGRWRRSVGYVPQQIAVIDESIAANVALGWFDSEIDERRVWSALERAQADEFVRSLPDGIATPVGDRGVRLSGGEAQRIGIARALYVDPQFLVLDEATSSLDVETEAAVTAALSNLHGSTTVLVIAHRLSTVRDADEVFYLEDGTLVCSGPFEHVARTVPRFAEHARLAGLAGPSE